MSNKDASEQPSNPKPRVRVRKLAFTTIALLLLVLFGLLITPWARDAANAFTYDQPDDVTDIASKMGMTSKSRFIFRASQPELLDREQFNRRCQQYEKGTTILGCYADNQIHVFDIDNPQLENSKTVTMVHELLHAIYVRLSGSEKAELQPLLEQVYQQQADADLQKRMDMYERNEPGQKYNELHSIVATEFADIPQELEDYYSQYLTDRQQIVEYDQQYQQIFSNLEDQAKQLQQWLESQGAVIEQRMADYKVAEAEFSQASRQLASDADSLDRTDSEAVDRYNQRVYQHNLRRDQLVQASAEINQLIDEYNQKVEQLNQISDRTKGLFDSMNSQPIKSV